MKSQEPRKKITRALVSVYNKEGLSELAKALQTAGVEIVSTGSTANAIKAAGVPVTVVETVTGFPEILDGRVKTLHPKIHGGLLADTRNPEHVNQLVEHNIAPFDLVVGNLYPFVDALQEKGDSLSEGELVELIDIGGPAMLRAAAKNFHNIAVVSDPQSYPELAARLELGGFTSTERREMAAAVFALISDYDREISNWLVSQTDGAAGVTPNKTELRYGENPHQKAWVVAHQDATGLANAVQLHGKPMSYNNYVDADAAWRAAHDHSQPAVAIIKHANPCGIAVAGDVAQAYKLALATDPVSAFGSVVAVNRPVTLELAQGLSQVFTEVVIAPAYEPAALELLQQKKNLRLMQMPSTSGSGSSPEHGSELYETRPISGGHLRQEVDRYQSVGDNPANWTQVSGDPVSPETLADLEFAWRAVRAAKSNAILIAKGGAAKGIGMGQVNRVDAARLAVMRANELAGGAAGTVAASDAFFPFADGLQILLDAGITAVVQPGGSMRDAEVIAAAQKANIPMFLTGTRHFSH